MKKSCYISKDGFVTCAALEHDGYAQKDKCALNFDMKDCIPLEQCPKPRSYREYVRLVEAMQRIVKDIDSADGWKKWKEFANSGRG